MKIKSILRIIAITSIVLLLGAVSVRAQEKESITVKGAEVNNGVVLITAQGAKSPIELQCNKDFLGCTVLKPGMYVMVRLAKNRGPYECSNVTIYAKDQGPDSAGEPLGSYCIAEK